MTAEQAARLASKPVRVVRTDSIQAGLAAMVAYDPERSAEANVAEMHEALEALATGEVTVASRDAELNGVAVRKGASSGSSTAMPSLRATASTTSRGGGRAAARRAARRAHAPHRRGRRPSSTG